uniref:Uncharacterized protein n=1 Tax=Anopheles atroparvus TaxID=41427 RepID=A0AAG5DUY3_ANOAO
ETEPRLVERRFDRRRRPIRTLQELLGRVVARKVIFPPADEWPFPSPSESTRWSDAYSKAAGELAQSLISRQHVRKHAISPKRTKRATGHCRTNEWRVPFCDHERSVS